MTRKRDKQGSEEIKAMIAQEGDFLRPLVRTVRQEIMEAEMSETVGAQKGERVEGRLGYRSGYYPRGLVTRVGKLELRVPQDRQGRFSTEIFERYQRSEKALVAYAGSTIGAMPRKPAGIWRLGCFGGRKSIRGSVAGWKKTSRKR